MASTKPVYEKLGLKPTARAFKLSVPRDVEASLGRPPAGASFAAVLSGEFDFLLGFYESTKALKGDLAKIKRSLRKSGMAWVCWRKGNVTDLSRDSIHELVEATGLETVSSCAIDGSWSALKLMFPKDQRAKAAPRAEGTLAAFLDQYVPEVRDLAVETRQLVLKVMPKAIEQVDPPSKIVAYGFGTKMADIVCAIAPHKSHVNLMFSMGASMADPDGLLEGTGKLARHVKVRSSDDLKRAGVRQLLKQASSLMTQKKRA